MIGARIIDEIVCCNNEARALAFEWRGSARAMRKGRRSKCLQRVSQLLRKALFIVARGRMSSHLFLVHS
uniref:Uncharacterized protein n=1 Tax=Parascaris equorum TaxID=6256 RepID=A0A914S6S9_PAREQ